MYELLQMILMLAAGIGSGYLVARTKTFSDYNEMYSHLTCEIVSRMTRAMRSMCVDQDMIDRVIKRMGCKLIPGPCPPPPTPPEKKKSIAELSNKVSDMRLQLWKPTDEQMRVLDLAIRCGINHGTHEETTLVSLFNDLKKLTEDNAGESPA